MSIELKRQDTASFIEKQELLAPQEVTILDTLEMDSTLNKGGKNIVAKVLYKGN